LASLLVLYVFAHRLPVQENGAYQGFWAQLNVFNAIAGMGISIFVYTYTPAKLESLFRTFTSRHFLGYSLFLLICGVVFAYLQIRNGLSLPVSILLLILFTFCNITDALLAVFRRASALIWINFLYALGFFLAHLWKLHTVASLDDLATLLLPLLMAKLVLSIRFIVKGVVVDTPEKQPQEAEIKSMRRLWMHLYFYDIIQISFLWLDKFIVSLLLSKEAAAIYINGSLNIPFLPLAFAAVSSAALMQLSTTKSPRQQTRVVQGVGRLLATMAFPLFFFFLFFKEDFILSFFSEKYEVAIPIFLCSIMILPLRAYNHTIILQSREQGAVINRGALLDLVLALSFMYPLYLFMGLPGVALSFVLSTVVQVIYYFQHSRKIVEAKVADLLPLKNWTIKLLGFGLLAFLLHLILPDNGQRLFRLFMAALVMGGISGAILLQELRMVKKKQVAKAV